MFDVYFLHAALEKADAHTSREAAKGLEAMGLLVGGFYSHEGAAWVLVEDYVTVRNDSSAVRVRFAEASLPALVPQLSAALDGGKVVVGWLHSHPGLDCFLSYTDIATQQNYFDHPQSVAVVVDPSKAGAGGRMKTRVFRVDGAGRYPPDGIPFAVVEPPRQ